jgi:hypothetical protein
MSDEDKKIIYILIGSGKKPLAGYGIYKGDFIQICEKQLARCKENQSACINTGSYKIYYEYKDKVIYLLMTMPIYPISAAVACIESLKKEFGKDLQGRNFNAIGDYGLNIELQEKLKMKFEYYNENTEVVSDSLQGLKNQMMKFKDEVFQAAESLNERGELLNEMQNKAKDLESDSYTYKRNAIKVRKTECCRKATYIGIICGVVAAIVLIIVLCVVFKR